MAIKRQLFVALWLYSLTDRSESVDLEAQKSLVEISAVLQALIPILCGA